MFRKYYKEANDDIKPNRELIDKIFEQAETARAPKKRIYKLAYAAAAAAAIAVSVYSYPQLVRFAENDVQLAETAENSQKTAKNAAETADSAKTAAEDKSAERTENAEEVPSVTAEKAVRKNGGKTKNEPLAEKDNDGAEREKQSAADEKNAVRTESEAPTQAGGAAEAAAQKSISAENAESAEDAENADGSITMFSAGNTETMPSDAPVGGAAKAGGGSGAEIPVKWSIEDYCAYLGTDVRELAELPGDMKSAVPNEIYLRTENGKPADDSVAFIFGGTDGRMVSIVTSRNNFNDESMQPYSGKYGDTFFAGFRAHGIYIEIYARGLSEDEMSILTESLK